MVKEVEKRKNFLQESCAHRSFRKSRNSKVIGIRFDSEVLIALAPITMNQLDVPALSLEVYSFCVWMGILGIIYYVGLIAFSAYKKLRKK